MVTLQSIRKMILINNFVPDCITLIKKHNGPSFLIRPDLMGIWRCRVHCYSTGS